METQRQSKIGALLQKDISELFQRECQEFCSGKMISVTKVRISPDLSIAKVYISIFPTSDKETVLAGINKASSQIRFHLSKRVGKQLRIMPNLRFYIDDSLDYIDNIDNLLK